LGKFSFVRIDDFFYCAFLKDERYSADENTYDWYQDYSTLKAYIDPYLNNIQDFEILVAGCGNSSKLFSCFWIGLV
jgi:hypothetical protein